MAVKVVCNMNSCKYNKSGLCTSDCVEIELDLLGNEGCKTYELKGEK
jgi:hypothetical protein